MTTDLVLIACSKAKRSRALPAFELYSSPHFDYQLDKGQLIADQLGAQLGILSAKHGIVDLDSWLEPYNVRMGDSGSIRSADLVEQLRARGVRRIVALLPMTYRWPLELACHQAGVELVNGFTGCKGIGEQRGRLAELADDASSLEDAPALSWPKAVPPAFVTPAKLDRSLRANEAANRLGAVADQLAELRRQLELELREAAAAGVPERQLAELSGLARGTVRSIIGR